MTFVRSVENYVFSLVFLGWICAGIVGLSCADTERASALFVTTITVPPFLESIVFDLESGPPDALTVQPRGEPEAVALSDLAGSRLRASRSLTSLEVRRPTAGAWRFVGPGEPPRVRIREMESHLRGRLVEPSGGVAGEDCKLRYEVVDIFGEPLSVMEASSLKARAWLSASDGAIEPLTLLRDPSSSEQVIYFSGTEFCRRPGRYRLEVELATRDLAGRFTLLFHDAAHGFTVPGSP